MIFNEGRSWKVEKISVPVFPSGFIHGSIFSDLICCVLSFLLSFSTLTSFVSDDRLLKRFYIKSFETRPLALLTEEFTLPSKLFPDASDSSLLVMIALYIQKKNFMPLAIHSVLNTAGGFE